MDYISQIVFNMLLRNDDSISVIVGGKEFMQDIKEDVKYMIDRSIVEPLFEFSDHGIEYRTGDFRCFFIQKEKIDTPETFAGFMGENINFIFFGVTIDDKSWQVVNSYKPKRILYYNE